MYAVALKERECHKGYVKEYGGKFRLEETAICASTEQALETRAEGLTQNKGHFYYPTGECPIKAVSSCRASSLHFFFSSGYACIDLHR